MVVEFAEKSLVGKARSRPDLVRQVLDKAQREGVLHTVQAAFNRLDQPMALGYSSAGTIVALGEDMDGFQGRRAGGLRGRRVRRARRIQPGAAQPAYAAAGWRGFRVGGLHHPGRDRHARFPPGRAAGRRARGGDRDGTAGSAGGADRGRRPAAACSASTSIPQRVELADSLGLAGRASATRRRSLPRAFTSNRGFDVVLICADTPSNDPVELAGGHCPRPGAGGGRRARWGWHIPRKVYYEKELSFINSRSYGPGRYDPSYEENGQRLPDRLRALDRGAQLRGGGGTDGAGKTEGHAADHAIASRSRRPPKPMRSSPGRRRSHSWACC